ncbi:hypothetical protein [Thermotoga sp.]|uniref:flavodoxin family protein n=1 Tax=Thermotoga sp. TaxID=28240 RepID=UPI0025DE61FA|nr:hypothetical protein [Thermotoga sp.]MCD6551226.1 hypothetical protein [Thermotoga sp.]
MTNSKQNKSKKILVAFYSRDGHTRKVAKLIAKRLNADIDEIEDKKPRKGLIGFLIAGYDATRGKTTEITFSKDPSDYEIVILGSPVWNGRLTPAVRTYLLENKEKIKKACFFVTCGIKGGKALTQMHEIYGGEVLGEKVVARKNLEEEARRFAEELKSMI